jgi:SAM-dependent methyltransferase
MAHGYLFLELIKNSKSILDIGCGPHGSYWYSLVPEGTEIIALDLLCIPTITNKNFSLYKMDAMELDRFDTPSKIIEIKNGLEIERQIYWKEKFDFVVADHVFEHMSDPKRLARGVSIVTKKEGHVHIGIPDPLNFTERFYHLIHPEGGGHVSKITKDEMIKMMNENGFVLRQYQDWIDDWQWLKKLYDWKKRGLQYFSQEDLDFIADTFIKELTPEKGYFYGGEYVFQKKYK